MSQPAPPSSYCTIRHYLIVPIKCLWLNKAIKSFLLKIIGEEEEEEEEIVKHRGREHR